MKNITYYMQYDREKYTGVFELDRVRTERGAKKAARNIAIKEGIEDYYILYILKNGSKGVVIKNANRRS